MLVTDVSLHKSRHFFASVHVWFNQPWDIKYLQRDAPLSDKLMHCSRSMTVSIDLYIQERIFTILCLEYNWMNSTDEILFLGENAHEDFKQRTISYVYYIFQPWMLYHLQWNTDKELLLNASVHQAQPTKTNHSRFMKRLECL